MPLQHVGVVQAHQADRVGYITLTRKEGQIPLLPPTHASDIAALARRSDPGRRREGMAGTIEAGSAPLAGPAQSYQWQESGGGGQWDEAVAVGLGLCCQCG